MLIYGWTRINSEGDYHGRESYTKLFFQNYNKRNERMYEDYEAQFDALAENEGFEKKDGVFVDADGNPKMSKEEFIKEVEGDRDNEKVHGLIQGYDHHIQYEKFYDLV